jgi:putative hydrolase of the HAD superfamily
MPIPRGAVRAISFDYGHVLGGLDLDELAARLATGSHSPDPSALRAAMPSAYRAHDEAIARGEGHEAGWRALMSELVSAALPSIDEPSRAGEVDALWRAQPDRNLWRHVPDEARTLLSDFEARGVRMVITSNSEGRVAELLGELGIAQRFVAILDSGRLGFGKPDRRIFALAAEKLGVSLAELVHVGDSEKADVVGAKDAGAFAARYDGFVPGADAVPTIADARASTYPELRALLWDALALD